MRGAVPVARDSEDMICESGLVMGNFSRPRINMDNYVLTDR